MTACLFSLIRPVSTLPFTLAAVLSLQAQSPAPQNPETWPPHFVSLTPDLLYEVEPSDYIADPATLDGAQLFYAPVQGDDPVASLQEAAVLLVRPYNTAEWQEAPLREWECVWGTLDHLYRDKVPQFWRRPSTAFYSCTHPTRSIKKPDGAPDWKVQVDFVDWTRGMRPWQQVLSRYYAGLSDKPLSALGLFTNRTYPEDKLMDVLNGSSGLSKADVSNVLLARFQFKGEKYPRRSKAYYPLVDALQRNTAVHDFRGLAVTRKIGTKDMTLWEEMLNREAAGGTVRSAWVEGQWLQRANAGGRSPFVHWWMSDWLAFSEGVLPDDAGAIVWEEEFVKTLNETAGQYDGLLCLKDAGRVEKDFIKKMLLPKSVQDHPVPGKFAEPPQANAVPFSQAALYAEVLQNAKVDPNKDAGTPPFVHLVPFAAKVHQKGTPEDGDTVALAKAVILSDGRATKRNGDFVVLAITCDWKDKSSATDGITVTKTFQSNATLEQDLRQRVDRAEYSRIARSCYTFRTDAQTQEASYAWQGPDSGVRLEENALQSPAAFRAGASGLKYRLLVAVREDIDGKWTLMAEPEPMKGALLDEGTYYAYTKENLARTVRQVGCRPLAKSITFASPEKPGRYFLYEVDVQQDYALTPCIRYGNMKHVWVLRRGEHRRYTDRTEMTEVYTIYGDSTWPKSGAVADMATPYGNAVLVWEDALKVMCRAYMADRNTYRNEATLKPPANAFFHLATYPVGPGYPARDWTYQGARSFRSNYSVQGVPYTQVNGQWQPSGGDVLAVFDIVRLVGDVLSGHGADDPKAMCLEAASMTAVLPRICGFRECIEVHWAAVDIRDINGSPYTVEGHYFNVLNNRVYDVTPYTVNADFPDQNIKTDNHRFNIQFGIPFLDTEMNTYMQQKGFNNNLLRKVCTKIKLEAITPLNS